MYPTRQKQFNWTWAWSCFQPLVHIYGSVMCDLKAFNPENVPTSGGVLMLSNHQSFLDPPLIGSRLPRMTSFMARSTLFDFKPLGWLLRSVNTFPVRRGRGDIGAMKMAIDLLRQGHQMMMFPEGTRSPDGSLQPIAAGAALVVKRAGVPVVPIAIDGTFHAWPRHHLLPGFGKARISFGRPIELHTLDSRDIVDRIGGEFQRLLNGIHHYNATGEKPAP